MIRKLSILFLGLAVLLAAFPAGLPAQSKTAKKAAAPAPALEPAAVLNGLNFRAIGPTRQSGRFVDFAVPPGRPNTFYAASASGGLWKTENNGQTFEPLFDKEKVFSIGDIAVAPSAPDTLWLGSGEANNSRSTYWGDGDLQVRRRRQDLAEHGAQGVSSHRAGRRPSRGPERRLRGRAGPPLFGQSRARRLQDLGRRPDLGQGPGHRRRRPGRRRRRPGHGPLFAGHALCRGLRQVPPALDLRPRRAGLGHPQDGRRRQDLDQADRRPPLGHPRADRPGRCAQGPEDRLRGRRERQQARDVAGGPLAGDPGRQVQRRHDRRRSLPVRRRRRHLGQGQPGEAIRRRLSRLLLRPDHRRPERLERGLHPQRRRAGQPGRRQDLEAAVQFRGRQPRPLDRSAKTAATCSSATTTASA